MSIPLPQLAEIEMAIDKLSTRLRVVDLEVVPIANSAGRILAQPLLADRDSPAVDVSAMDGYAVQIADVAKANTLPVVGTSMAGTAPMQLRASTAIKIFTGAPLPTGANCIIRRENTTEHSGQVAFNVEPQSLQLGQNIRRKGENIHRGQVVLEAGTELNSAAMAAIASFGGTVVSVHRPVRVAVLNTGDELAAPGSTVEDWQIRDSNGPTLAAWLSRLPWVQVVARSRVHDNFDAILAAIDEQTRQCDAVILTGGVSMGDTDYVPGVVEALGGEIVFHRLPIRPGKPILGGCYNGKLLLGLPGNPVSVAVTAKVFGEPLLSRLAGRSKTPEQTLVTLAQSDEKQLPLVWYRLVEIDSQGYIYLSRSQGSGDIVSLARSAGFVTIPPGGCGTGPWGLTIW